MKPRTFIVTFLASLLCGAISPAFAEEKAAAPGSLGSALLLYAPFDGKLDAVRAAGDPVLYTAATGNRKEAQPGLPADNLVIHVKGEGKHGDALRFTKKMKPVVFFRGEKNLGYQTKNWTGALS